uniref:Uncharacterized protein n=1 Tax=Mustela putorius furo TaxID=9669 RepID=M3XUJ2_MUSPF
MLFSAHSGCMTPGRHQAPCKLQTMAIRALRPQLSSSFPPFQPRQPPQYSSDRPGKLLPLGLCTCCAHCLLFPHGSAGPLPPLHLYSNAPLSLRLFWPLLLTVPLLSVGLTPSLLCFSP